MKRTLKQYLQTVDWDKVTEEALPKKQDALEKLIHESSTYSRLTPPQLRVKLAHDIFSSAWLELPPSKAFLYAFSDGVSILEWASALGIHVTVNQNTDPEFRSRVTLIFKDVRHERYTDLETCEDEEL